MTTFDKREEGFEKKLALDEEQKFKAEARRNKLLGLWAAEKLGISGDAAAAYAREVVAADFEEAGDGDVLRKVAGDLGAKGIYYRTMVGPFGSTEEAARFCGNLKSAGGQCVIEKMAKSSD